ncbi:MAG: Pycsar system effector family protein [Bacteroidota bacterium]
MDNSILERQAKLAEAYMSNADSDNQLSYHNWAHVSKVLDSVRLLSKDLDNELQVDLSLAALWHDADYANGSEAHEERSAQLAMEKLGSENLNEERKERIKRLILATRMEYIPKSEDEKIIKDADLSHLASKEYLLFYNNLRKEINSLGNHSFTSEEWRQECVKFMQSMSFLSEKGKLLFTNGKEENLKIIKNMSEDLAKLPDEELTKEQKKALKRERKRHEPKFNPEKGIETMFRVALRNHINLSRIADDKANTLISVNAIILSIVLSALFPKLDSNPFLLYPGISLILVSITTIIIATLSTIPKTTHGTVSEDDVKNKRGNLLFFGNFHSMSLKEYEWGIGELMKDGQYLYGSLTRDLYFLGKVLNRKYNYLRYAYLIFVLGLIISIFLFVWSIVTLPPEATL